MSVMPKYLATLSKEKKRVLHFPASKPFCGSLRWWQRTPMQRHMRPAAAGGALHVQVVRQKKMNSTAKMKAKNSQRVSKCCARAHWGKDTPQENVSGISLYRQHLVLSVNDWWRLQVFTLKHGDVLHFYVFFGGLFIPYPWGRLSKTPIQKAQNCCWA